MKASEIKLLIQEKYSEIANSNKESEHSCCCSNKTYTIFSEDYSNKPGYIPSADLQLGCGIPTDYSGIKPNNHVLDLGSGAGNDCFVARRLTGDKGLVVGLDFTDAMLEKARKNAEKLSYTNVEFVKGDIEEMPFQGNKFDVIISNCVLNLVPNKAKAFSEMYRVLTNGGHFCVSDVVIRGNLPVSIKDDADMYASCVSGALPQDAYIGLLEKAGFKNIEIKKEKCISLPQEILKNHLSEDDASKLAIEQMGIYSITVIGYK